MTAQITSFGPAEPDPDHLPVHLLDPIDITSISISTETAPRSYEERKRDLILASLPQRHYRLAVEPGCGTGVVSEGLAGRCDRVLAWDVDPAAVAVCRRLTGRHPNLEVRPGDMPSDWPTDIADLIVISEIGYYLGPAELDALIERACLGLAPGGTLVAAHHRAPGPDFATGADDVHAHLFGRVALTRLGGYSDEELRLDVFRATR